MPQKRLTQEEVVSRFKKTHGNTYDYSKFVYDGMKKSAIITCRIHGDFLQKPSAHIHGSNCPVCNRIHQRTMVTKPNQNFHYDVENFPKMTPFIRKSYLLWRAMMRRCYDEEFLLKHPTYRGCCVCDEWKTFSKFFSWFKENYVEGYDLDKDLLTKGNKVYSPNTCCFVPHELNGFSCKCNAMRTNLPIGVSYSKGFYVARMRKHMKNVELGQYTTPLEAFEAYKNEKERHAKDLAKAYFKKGMITKRVYDALMNYKVEITD